MKFLLNPITVQKMASLQNTVIRLIIILLGFSYDAYHQGITFNLLHSKCR